MSDAPKTIGRDRDIEFFANEYVNLEKSEFLDSPQGEKDPIIYKDLIKLPEKATIKWAYINKEDVYKALNEKYRRTIGKGQYKGKKPEGGSFFARITCSKLNAFYEDYGKQFRELVMLLRSPLEQERYEDIEKIKNNDGDLAWKTWELNTSGRSKSTNTRQQNALKFFYKWTMFYDLPEGVEKRALPIHPNDWTNKMLTFFVMDYITRKGVKPASIRRFLMSTYSFLSQGMLDENHAKRVRGNLMDVYPKLGKEEKIDKSYLTRDQVAKVYKHLPKYGKPVIVENIKGETEWYFKTVGKKAKKQIDVNPLSPNLPSVGFEYVKDKEKRARIFELMGKCMITFLLQTGARYGKKKANKGLMGVRLEHVYLNLENPQIWMRDKLKPDGWEFYLSKSLEKDLKAYLKLRLGTDYLKTKPDKSTYGEYLFPVSYDYLRRLLHSIWWSCYNSGKPLLDEKGKDLELGRIKEQETGKGFTAHIYRKTFVALMSELGYNLEEISELAIGWDDLATLKKYYFTLGEGKLLAIAREGEGGRPPMSDFIPT